MAITHAPKTYSPKASEITHAWRLVDADGQTLGRLASQVAGFLRGKHKPTFAEHMDVGDYVVVINASKNVFAPGADFGYEPADSDDV